MKPRSPTWRRVSNRIVTGVSALGSLAGIFVLGWILYEVIMRGANAIGPAFFTQRPPPPGTEGGGMGPAILGTLLITVMATVIGVPIGLMTGIYLAEYGKKSSLAAAVRFATNVLMGVPSIIVGVFVYFILVMKAGTFSAHAGAAALAIIMLPIVGRTSEDMIALVPNALREAALALGTPRWKVILSIVFRAARPALVTGSLLAVARVSGETAPLLFTALNSPYWLDSLSQPTANLTVTIFQFAMAPYDNWQQLAWGASLLITVGVLFLNITARFMFRGGKTA